MSNFEGAAPWDPLFIGPENIHNSHGGPGTAKGTSGVCVDYYYMDYKGDSQKSGRTPFFSQSVNRSYLQMANNWGFTRNYARNDFGSLASYHKGHSSHGHLTYKNFNNYEEYMAIPYQ